MCGEPKDNMSCRFERWNWFWAMKLSQPNAVGVVARVPELPKFIDRKYNLDSYLQCFERFARSNKWGARWLACFLLSALLTGRALDVYFRLSETTATDYD